jgi:TRAP-type C4-dicarboxylate transport system permease small subunit
LGNEPAVASLDDNIDLDAEPRERSAGFERFARILAGIGTVWIFALMILIVVDVLGRNFFNSPVTGVAEVAGRSVVAMSSFRSRRALRRSA